MLLATVDERIGAGVGIGAKVTNVGEDDEVCNSEAAVAAACWLELACWLAFEAG